MLLRAAPARAPNDAGDGHLPGRPEDKREVALHHCPGGEGFPRPEEERPRVGAPCVHGDKVWFPGHPPGKGLLGEAAAEDGSGGENGKLTWSHDRLPVYQVA